MDDDDIVNINSTIHSLVLLAADCDYHESLMTMPCKKITRVANEHRFYGQCNTCSWNG